MLTRILLRAVMLLNPYKDRLLARHLRDLAELYDPRPAIEALEFDEGP